MSPAIVSRWYLLFFSILLQIQLLLAWHILSQLKTIWERWPEMSVFQENNCEWTSLGEGVAKHFSLIV